MQRPLKPMPHHSPTPLHTETLSAPLGATQFELLHPGIWRLRAGEPEAITPVSARGMAIDEEGLLRLGEGEPPWLGKQITHRVSERSCTVFLPHSPEEGIFGFGLQLKSHLQSGKKRQLRVNADPVLDQGDSHAPVPFYLSTQGYGVLVDTARYAAFYVGTHAPVSAVEERVRQKGSDLKFSVDELYRSAAFGDRVVVDVPAAKGVDVYVFAGPTPLEALQRYVLFSGGGCLPPVWALGNWFRAYAEHSETEVLALARKFREEGFPFDVMGLEPGWHTHFYPNSFVWSDRFPDPAGFAAELGREGFRLNLWENAFVHPEAPFAGAIRPHCGDELSTDGLAPDFLDPEAVRIFAEHHERELVAKGAAGFKLDECDNGDFLPFAWSFPEYTAFPSGADGEQMHSLYGVLYQRALGGIFTKRNQRHFDLVRSSGALASSLPYVLYSDLYDHTDFLRGVVNSGTSGLLWCPEVRHADSCEDLVRRVQSVVFSALSMINAWYIPSPPWEQIDQELNRRGVPMERQREITDLVRTALETRMRLIPYLYTAFARYAFDGIPPVRAMFLEAPEDLRSWGCDTQFLLGASLLVAPLVAGQTGRTVYLPPGGWYDFETGVRYEGAAMVELKDVPLSKIPVFVREGSILPLARLRQCVRPGERFEIEAVAYGAGECACELYEDDGTTFAYREENARTWHGLSIGEDGHLRVATRGQGAGSQYVFASNVRRFP